MLSGILFQIRFGLFPLHKVEKGLAALVKLQQPYLAGLHHVHGLRDFDGKHLQSVAQGSGDLSELEDEEEAAAKEQASAEFAGLAD